MGWTSTIISSNNITEEQIQKVINNMPKEFLGESGVNCKHEWGWNCYCDIRNPKGNTVNIEGPFTADPHKANRFISTFTENLSDLGHTQIAATPMR